MGWNRRYGGCFPEEFFLVTHERRFSIVICQRHRWRRRQNDLSVAICEASKPDHDWAQCAFVVYVRFVIFGVAVSTRCVSVIASECCVVFATVGSCWTCDFFAAHACAVLEEMSCLLLDFFCFTSSGISVNANETRKVVTHPPPQLTRENFITLILVTFVIKTK